MAPRINHELYSPKKRGVAPFLTWKVFGVAAALVLVVSAGANWDRLTKNDEDRFRAAYAAGRLDEALVFAEKIAAGNPTSATAQLGLAATYIQKALRGQDAAASLVAARRAALLAGELDPKNPDAWRAAGYTYELAGNLKLAIEYYQKAIDAAPGNVPALIQMGSALLAQGKTSAGERHFELAVAADPSHPWARIFLARVRVERGSQSAADTEKLLEPAIESDEPLAVAEAVAIVSGLRLAAGKSEEAEELARAAVEASPDSVAANLALGEALYDGIFSRKLPWGETLAEVRAIGDRVATLDPARAAGPYLALRAAAAAGDTAAAQAYQKTALALAATDPTLSAAARASLRLQIQKVNVR